MKKRCFLRTLLLQLTAGLAFTMMPMHASATESDKNWDDIMAQAKKEGSITFSVWYLQPQWRDFVKKFEQQYGIKVRIPEGTLDGNINKLLAESKRSKGKIDVIALSINYLPVVQSAKALEKVDWIPEYKNAWHSIQNIDTEGYAAIFWGNQTGFAYDPIQIGNQPLPQNLEQLQQFIDSNPKKFGYNDPGGGGAGQAFIQRVITLTSGNFDIAAKQTDAEVIKSWQKGWQWFAQNKTKVTYTASGADSLTRLNDGELILTPAWEDHLASLQKSGAITSRLKFYIPDFGMPGGGNVAGIAANSPHPAASAVFLNWLLQAQTQHQLHDTFGVRKMNKTLTANTEDQQKTVDFFGAAYNTEIQKAFINNVMLKNK